MGGGYRDSSNTVDGTAQFEIANLDKFPVGSLLYMSGDIIPDGWLLCNGAEVSKSDFPDLYDYLEDKYGETEETFTLPNLIDKFLEGNTTAGEYKEAGLPNIEGDISSTGPSIGNNHANGTTSNGALKGQDFNIKSTAGASQNALYMSKIVLNASLSNAIYGKSTTVQPPAMTGVPVIKY